MNDVVYNFLLTTPALVLSLIGVGIVIGLLFLGCFFAACFLFIRDCVLGRKKGNRASDVSLYLKKALVSLLWDDDYEWSSEEIV